MTTNDTPAVWVLLIERRPPLESDLSLYWHEADAVEAARSHLVVAERLANASIHEDIYAAIESANGQPGSGEHIVLAPFAVAGNQYFEGVVDRRTRCAACREPIELNDPDEPGSWIHAADANDLGDHTAEGP